MKPAPVAGAENDLEKRRDKQPVEPEEHDRNTGRNAADGRKHVPAIFQAKSGLALVANDVIYR